MSARVTLAHGALMLFVFSGVLTATEKSYFLQNSALAQQADTGTQATPQAGSTPPITQSNVDALVQLLQQHPNGGPELTSKIFKAIQLDPSLTQAVLAAANNATEEQILAVVDGLQSAVIWYTENESAAVAESISNVIAANASPALKKAYERNSDLPEQTAAVGQNGEASQQEGGFSTSVDGSQGQTGTTNPQPGVGETQNVSTAGPVAQAANAVSGPGISPFQFSGTSIGSSGPGGGNLVSPN